MTRLRISNGSGLVALAAICVGLGVLPTMASATTLRAALSGPEAKSATAGHVQAAQKSVRSNAVPVSGAVVTKVTVQATISGSKLTVTLVPGNYPFAKKIVSLSGLVSDPSASTLKLSIKATGARKGAGSLTVTGPKNSEEPDVAVYSLSWSVASNGNTGTLKLTQKPA